MKLFRLLVAAAGVLLVARRLSRVLRGQLVSMSHPAGMFGAAQGSGRGWLRDGATTHGDRFEVGSYRDAGTALDRSWVDAGAVSQSAVPAGDDPTIVDAPVLEPPVANASEAGVVNRIEIDDLVLEADPSDED